MSGHVDQVVQVVSLQVCHGFTDMRLTGLTISDQKMVVKKGSIAINGVSLTVNAVNGADFSVMLVPHTLMQTNLALLREKDEVNLEFDIIARMIVSQCELYQDNKVI